MALLKRLLKPHRVRPLLARAQRLCGPGCQAAVVGDTLVIAADDPPPPLFSNPPRDVVHLPLRTRAGTIYGEVVIVPAEGCDPGHCSEMAEFLVDVLVDIIERELARKTLAVETLDRYREIELLDRASMTLNRSLKARDVTRALLDECQRASSPADAGLVFIREPGNGHYEPLSSMGSAREMQLERVLDSRLFRVVMAGGDGEIINNLAEDERWDVQTPHLRSLLMVPLSSQDMRVGALVLAATENEAFRAEHFKYVSILAQVSGIALGNARHFESIQTLMDALIQALATAIDARDPFTSGHSQRVAHLAVALARQVNGADGSFRGSHFNESELAELYYAGLLHDVGKIGVREQVLTKSSRLPEGRLEIIGKRLALFALREEIDWETEFDRLQVINKAHRLGAEDLEFMKDLSERSFRVAGRDHPFLSDEELHHLRVREGNLTPEERIEIQRHPEESRRILQHIPFPANFANLLQAIQQHHERLDGSGYPDGARGEEISVQSRIIAIVDIYDAMTQERHYKKALSREEAVRVLNQEAERGKIDPDLVALFCERIEAIEDDAQAMARLVSPVERLDEDSLN